MRALAACLFLSACLPQAPDSSVAADDELAEAAFLAELDLRGADGMSRVRIGGAEAVVRWAAIGGYAVLEGDVLIGALDEVTGLRGTTLSLASGRWPGGVVYYEVDPGLPVPQRAYDAMAAWEADAPVRFVDRASVSGDVPTDYVRFVDGSGCSSYIGRLGGPQELVLSTSCTTGSAIHELGHVLGLFHEQNRPDRNEHLEVIWSCIDPARAYNYDRLLADVAPLGPYDDQSIMHYDADAYLVAGAVDEQGQPCVATMRLLDGTWIPAQRAALSAGDLAAVTTMYGGGPAPLSAAVLEPPDPGGQLRVRAYGAEPGEMIYLAASSHGPGAGPCPAPMSGQCLDLRGPVNLLARPIADAYGIASVDLRIPPGLSLQSLAVQAVALRGGGAVKSEPASYVDRMELPCADPADLRDCAAACYPAAWAGDGACDDGAVHDWGAPDFLCAAHGFDGGVCL